MFDRTTEILTVQSSLFLSTTTYQITTITVSQVREVEPQIFFSVKCFDRINSKKFSPLQYCVIWYEKAADTIYESICTVAATSNNLIIVVTLRQSKINL